MKFETSTEQDIEQLQRWIDADLYHKNLFVPTWWLTGAEGSVLAFRFDDADGAVFYARIDKGNQFCRLYIQFGPQQEVSKSRAAKSLLKVIPVMVEYCKKQGSEGIIFNSTSVTLIEFGKRAFGFQPVDSNDFLLRFQEGT
jgi:hypothetical protein